MTPRRHPHGTLDLVATAMLIRDPLLTRTEIAKALGCSPKSLMNRQKYPALAREWDRINAGKWDRHGGETRHDRRRNRKSMPSVNSGRQ